MSLHAAGYRKVVEMLVKFINSSGGDNTLVYPLVFLTRHATELYLKEGIRSGRDFCKHRTECAKRGHGFCSEWISDTDANLSGQPLDVWKTHNLIKLSDYLTIMSKCIGYDLSKDDDWDLITKFLGLWERADPSGSFFRYPMDNYGTPAKVEGNVYAGNVVKFGLRALDTIEGYCIKLDEESRYLHEY